MKSPRKIACAALVLTSLVSGSAVGGQNPGPLPATPAQGDQAKPPAAPPKSQTTIVTTTTEVVVPVTVKDRNGNLVADLKKDEFRVLEDGVEQAIREFKTDTVPISMVVLIDNDLKLKDEQQVEPSLVSIIGGLSTSDEAFVCRFDQFFH